MKASRPRGVSPPFEAQRGDLTKKNSEDAAHTTAACGLVHLLISEASRAAPDSRSFAQRDNHPRSGLTVTIGVYHEVTKTADVGNGRRSRALLRSAVASFRSGASAGGIRSAGQLILSPICPAVLRLVCSVHAGRRGRANCRHRPATKGWPVQFHSRPN
jgi:hypothetical protein